MTAIDRHAGYSADVGFTAVILSNTTTFGDILDTEGFLSVNLITSMTFIAAGTFQMGLDESDDPTFTAFNTVDSEFIIGTLPSFTTANANAVTRVGYVGKKRFIRINFVSTGGAVGIPLSVLQAEFTSQPAPVAGLSFN